MKHYSVFGGRVAAARITSIAPVLGSDKVILVLEGEPYPITVPTGSHWRPGCYLTIQESGKLGAITERFFQLFFK